MTSAAPRDLTQLYKDGLAHQKAGRLSEARAAYQKLLLLRPNTAEALFQIGRIEAEAGQTAAAERALRKALSLKPKEAAIWQALYSVLNGSAAKKLARDAKKANITLGTEDEASTILSLIARDAELAETRAMALVQAAPGSAWSAFALGRARMAQGKWGGAVGPLEKALERAPTQAAFQIALGICLTHLGRPLRAEHLLLPHVPRDVDATLVLARSYRDTLRPEAAVEVLKKLAPTGRHKAAILMDLALSLAANGEAGAALATAETASAAGLSAVDVAQQMASALQEAGAVAGAVTALERGLEAAPDDAALMTRRAQFKQSAGDLAGADADLEAALRLRPDHADAYRAYIAGRKVTPDDPVLEGLQAQLKCPDLSTRARRVLNFAAAKAMGDIGDHAAVFPYLHRANRLTAEAFPYGFDADLAQARALVGAWPLLNRLEVDAPQDRVIFVTGLPRSGTTLVETILSAHSTVAAGGELPFLNRALAPAFEGVRADAPDPAAFAAAGRRYLRAARQRTQGSLFTDKSIATFSRVGHAATALPGARFVILQRDPRDVALSLYRNMFADGQHRYASNLTAIGRYIRLHNALVAFWAEALPDRVKLVSYEALTETPEPIIRDLVDFAGLSWEDACLAPERSTRRVETLSFATVRKPIGRDAVAGWKAHEAELEPLIEALAEPIDLTPEG
ncbi:MAG: sulfotransferase [Pseudomonadota bacterium]